MAKTEVRSIHIQGRFFGNREVEICTVCDGHRPVTKKVADGECLGHPGVKSYLLPLGEELPQAPRDQKKVRAKVVSDPLDQVDVEVTV